MNNQTPTICIGRERGFYIMNIMIFSKEEAQEAARKLQEPFIVISIADPGAPQCTFDDAPHLTDILYLEFWDSDRTKGISKAQAKRIRKFVEYHLYITSIKHIIVHCMAGVSRSAGIGAALMLIFCENDLPVFSNGRYRPNMKCYRAILEAFEFAYDIKEITKIRRRATQNENR